MIRAASLLALFACGAAAAQHPLTPAEGPASVQDLRNLAWTAGLGLEAFDYDIPEPWCLTLSVEVGEEFDARTEPPGGEPAAASEAGHICNRAGAWRFTAQWTRAAPDVEFQFMVYERDGRVGSAIGGTKVDLGRPDTCGGAAADCFFGWTTYALPERVLAFGQATEVLKLAATVSRDGRRVPVTVRATLEENPEGRMGSGGRVQTVSRQP